MNRHVPNIGVAQAVTDNFIPREHYVSPEFARAEKERLWPKTWQMACRTEEIAETGRFVVYDILDDSVIVVRTAEGIKAFHNVCPHRGNQLVEKSGAVGQFVCGFHGWSWNLAGENTFVKDAADWAGCPRMQKEDLHLKEVRTGEWGGFVFVNLDPNGETFESFIEPVPEFLDCLDFDKMRFVWYKTMPLAGNWKTTMESFMESYHVYTTHAQTIPYLDEISVSYEHGKHGKHGYPAARLLGLPSARSDLPTPADLRQAYAQAIDDLAQQTGGLEVRVGAGSPRSADAVRRVLDELGPEATIEEIHMAGLRFMQEAAEAEGAGWPTVTAEQGANLGVDWNIFPNMVLVFALDSTLVFRARPDRDDPNKCLFDMWGLMRVAPDKAPAFRREYYEDWKANRDKIPPLLVQDLRNIEKIQRGMNSSAFEGSRINPVQERQIYNHHRVLREYLAR